MNSSKKSNVEYNFNNTFALLNSENDELVQETKEINESTNTINTIKKLNTYWTVWIHNNKSTNWTLSGYQKIHIIDSIESFWNFTNQLQKFDMQEISLFVMREEIAPIWEDVNNKFGGENSWKINSIPRNVKTDLSVEIVVILLLLLVNETLIKNNKDLNGLTYCVKKHSTFIKLWNKKFIDEENKFIRELPKPLIDIFNSELSKNLKNYRNDRDKISIMYKQIKPEYDT